MSENARGATPWSYRTGEWYAVFGPSAAIVLPATHKDRVLALWALVDDGAGFDQVLDGLLASGLSSLPGFVLVGSTGGSTRVLLRGSGVIGTFLVAEDEITVDGGASHTWVEQSFDGVSALRIDLPAVEGLGELDLPIETGLVRVGRIDQPALSGADAPAATPAVPATPPIPALSVVPTATDEEAEGEVAETSATEAEVRSPLKIPTAASILADSSPSEEGATQRMDVVADRQLASAAAAAQGALGEQFPPAPNPDEEADDAGPEEGSPEGWVTPWDVGPRVKATIDPPAEASTGLPAGIPAPPTGPPPSAPPSLPPVPSIPPLPAVPAMPSVPSPPTSAPPTPSGPSAEAAGAATEVPPPGWIPAPPSAPGPGEPPPLPIGSWEPLVNDDGPEPTPPTPPTPPLGLDHDGLTVAGPGEPPAEPKGPAQAATPPGHAVATLLVSDGQSVVVDRAVLIGRAPEARRFTSAEQPVLVTVPSRLHEISSTHVEVRPGTGADHGTAVVTDMGSTNGTVLVQPGLGPEDLKPGIAVQLIPGAIINLGDGITIQVTRA